MIRLKDFIELDGKEYLVLTTNTLDIGLATGVFESVNKEVVSWIELYCRTYSIEDEACKGHVEVVDNLDMCIKIANSDIYQGFYDALNKMLKKFEEEE